MLHKAIPRNPVVVRHFMSCRITAGVIFGLWHCITHLQFCVTFSGTLFRSHPEPGVSAVTNHRNSQAVGQWWHQCSRWRNYFPGTHDVGSPWCAAQTAGSRSVAGVYPTPTFTTSGLPTTSILNILFLILQKPEHLIQFYILVLCKALMLIQF